MTTTQVIYGPSILLTDGNGQALVNGTLNSLGPDRNKAYRIAPHINADAYQDYEITVGIKGVADTDPGSQVSVYLYSSADDGASYEYDGASAIVPGLVTLTGNETLLGLMYLDGNTLIQKTFSLSANQRFNRGFPPSHFGPLVVNATYAPFNAADCFVRVRGIRNQEV